MSMTSLASVNEKLIESISSPPTSQAFFEGIYNLETDSWENIYKLPFLVTIENKIRAFQFKINHNIYYTNEKLYKVNLCKHEMCSFCGTEIETLMHIFAKCDYVNPLWEMLEEIFTYRFSEEDRIFGVYKELGLRSFDILSHCGIILKYYVHLCRMNNFKPRVATLEKRILYNEMLEKQIATNKNRLGKHVRKWRSVLDYFKDT